MVCILSVEAKELAYSSILGFGSEKVRIRVSSVMLDAKCFASILLADIH